MRPITVKDNDQTASDSETSTNDYDSESVYIPSNESIELGEVSEEFLSDEDLNHTELEFNSVASSVTGRRGRKRKSTGEVLNEHNPSSSSSSTISITPSTSSSQPIQSDATTEEARINRQEIGICFTQFKMNSSDTI